MQTGGNYIAREWKRFLCCTGGAESYDGGKSQRKNFKADMGGPARSRFRTPGAMGTDTLRRRNPHPGGLAALFCKAAKGGCPRGFVAALSHRLKITKNCVSTFFLL